MTTTTQIKSLLNVLGYLPEDGTAGVWIKSYFGYKIRIDLEKKQIDYGAKIVTGDKTTSNFNADENLVVLECVNRLLEKGYLPESIILEKDYPLGHKTKGKLDILVLDTDGKAFLMIECKTWGNEYINATKKTLKDGGQLLSYFQQDKSAKYLALYTSRLTDKVIEYKYGIIRIEPEFLEATNTTEVFERWNKNLKDNGIFEDANTPYSIAIKALSKPRLIPLTKDDSSRIFNQFAEILRHNVVSDKPNAFNKLITLLLCKIVDEDRGDDEELHFQWLEGDTNVALQKRLNDLYKVGMERYLTKVVTDYSDDDVENIVGLSAKQKDLIKHMMTELRLKKNNEFAFKEVFNDASFEENSKVLREVVELLQPYQVRYNKKHQFLGDFFELLLNTSIKQEAGQFFTPVPIARFIVNSIPIKELIQDKISKGDTEFLPYVIDYAVGSGHFLTEIMDEIHNILRDLNKESSYKPSVKKNLSKWSEDYDWAYNYIYGIEKDYRLVKTAKVSCFLNGDGLARIFNADGLGNFLSNEDFQDRLKVKSSNKQPPRDNQQFEIIVANPPYSVSAFKNTLKDGNKSFELYSRLTDESSEIECLFVERTKQLLKDKGYAGVILPISILSNNSNIYTATREVILKFFRIVAITEFGSNTFMATGTNTVVLFLERRNNSDWEKIDHAVDTFVTTLVDVTCNGIETPVSKYVEHVYKTVSFKDYCSLLEKQPTQRIKEHEIFISYKKDFDESTPIKNLKKKAPFKALQADEQQAELDSLFYKNVIKLEREKLLYFILTYPQNIVLVKANPDGKNESEKSFLGYEFSNRRGHEGIKPYGARTINEATLLYDENLNLNPEKINTHIYNAFLGKRSSIGKSIEKNITYQPLIDMMNFDRVEFSKSILLTSKKKVVIESKWPSVKLDDINILLKRGKSPVFGNSSIQVIKSGQARGYRKFDFSKRYFLKAGISLDERSLKKGDVLINSTGVGTAGRVTLFDLDGDFVVDSHITILRADPKKALPAYIVYVLAKLGFKNIEEMAQGQSGQIELSLDIIKNIKIPLPPKNIQESIVKEIDAVQEKTSSTEEQLVKCKSRIAAIYTNKKSLFPLKKLSSVIDIISGGTPRTNEPSYWNGDIPWLSVVDFNNEDRFVSKTEKTITEAGLKNSNTKYLNKGDIIISARGTVGALAQLAIPMTFNQSCYGIRGKEMLDNGFLYYALKYEIDQFRNNASGAIFDAITIKTFDSILIPVPPLNEQRQILRKIENLEEEIRGIQKVLEQADVLKAAVFNKYL